jgi:acetyl esterase/lipase
MRKLLFILILFTVHHSFAQRYLTPVYPSIDSLIGGTYGNALNYLSVNQNLLYDFYSPTADTAQKRPLIIYIHGGGFTSGTRSYPSVKLLCRKMAMKGYAVASLDYRLDPNFDLYNSSTNRRAMTDAMQDAKQAIRFFKANANAFKLDTNKIFIGGESAGAITSMMASSIDKQSEMLSYPMANPNDPVGSTVNLTYGNAVQATMCLCGTILDTTAIERASNPPVLWTHGSADTFIPIALAFNVVLRAAHIGLPIQTKLYQGATHCPWYYGNPNWQTYLDSTINDITSFLYAKATEGVVLNDVQRNESSFTLHPNPVKDNLNIDLDQQYSSVTISLLSSIGQVYKNWNFSTIKNIRINLSGMEAGCYIIKMELDNKVVLTRKIMIAE